ncbi:MAG: TetR/AcrR family transcriptional regulator [Bryobacteraceae bacterium]
MARTPSKEAHRKVLDAALQLIAERGIEGTSMDAIASLSGVSKATVYKHWANKDALLVDLIRQQAGKLPEFDSGNSRADLTDLIRYLAQMRPSEQIGRIWPRVIGYAASNADFAQALRSFSFEPRRVQIARILQQAVERGELPGGIDPAFAMDLLVGPLLHRRFTGDKNPPPDLADRIVEHFWKAMSIPHALTPRPKGPGAPDR